MSDAIRGPGQPPEKDGRRRRRQQSREAILRALAEAISEPDFEASPEQLAARSGYSISTIFRHFGSRDGLSAAIQDLVRSRVDQHLAAGPFEGDVRARVAELVRRVSAVFETAMPFLRAVEPDRQRTVGDPARRILDLRVRCEIDAALAPRARSPARRDRRSPRGPPLRRRLGPHAHRTGPRPRARSRAAGGRGAPPDRRAGCASPGLSSIDTSAARITTPRNSFWADGGASSPNAIAQASSAGLQRIRSRDGVHPRGVAEVGSPAAPESAQEPDCREGG